ncbi:polysaccharide biosynthesis/export family protein [Variovorax robiniae]|uniref:Polysaccharide biosynthesis/export family protein n=1 Tax=Variovorax robiniae TaxID=1836199 RepID=A0ABU8X9Z1_9BURK
MATTAAGAPQPDAGYTFEPGDEFDLRVPDAPQLDQSLRVLPDGNVSLPLMGVVRFQDRTVDEVQKDLRARLDKLAGEAPNREYLLRPNDELEIKFPFAKVLNDVVRLRPDGKIQLQLVGMVRAEGRSPEELAQDLRARYATYVRNPDVAVIVRTVNSQSVRTANGVGRAGLFGLKPTIVIRSYQAPQVFVGGEVAKPGTLPFRPGLSLVQAMVEAGGQLPSGDPSALMLLRRRQDNTLEVVSTGFTADALRSPDRDILLRPFDVVMLPKSGVAIAADKLNQYVYNLVPFLKNGSIALNYDNVGRR